jgi:hypothetical protein
MRSRAEVDAVRELAAQGLNHCAIARATGVPRSTLRGWLAGDLPRRDRSPPHEGEPWEDPLFPRAAYAYLLGVYLGDGFIAQFPRAACLRVYCDARYPGIIGEIVTTMRRVRPGNRVSAFRQVPTNCVVVLCYSQRWPALLPQHGPGRKHERRIELTDWQREVTYEHPERFVRGLLHSDGCRFINPVRAGGRRYEYPRYLFTNVSEDIKTIFCEHIDLLGIAWRRVGSKNISIARREAVAKLDAFVGPKR